MAHFVHSPLHKTEMHLADDLGVRPGHVQERAPAKRGRRGTRIGFRIEPEIVQDRDHFATGLPATLRSSALNHGGPPRGTGHPRVARRIRTRGRNEGCEGGRQVGVVADRRVRP